MHGSSDATGDVSTSFEVSEHAGDFGCFKAGSAVVQSFLQDCKPTSELGNFGLNNAALLIVFSVTEYLSMYCPLVQGVWGRGEDVEPCGWPAKELKELGGHGLGRRGWVIGHEVELCDVDQFLCFPSCQHLHLSVAQPADVSRDDLKFLFRGDCAVDASVVRLESWGYFNVAQLVLEGGDAFVALGNTLSFGQDTSLALAHVLGVLQRLVVDGGDEAIGRGSDSLVDIVLFEEDVLGGFGR
jgi:hypothetical protein